MIPEDGEIFYPHDPTQIIFVFLLDACQYGNFHECLLDEFGHFLYNLQSLVFFGLVVEHFQDLAEAALVDSFNDLVSVCNVAADFVLVKMSELFHLVLIRYQLGRNI